MNTKHTPGPWHVGMNPGPMVYGPHGEQVADCRNMFLEPNEDGCNARLIAAAPDLLAIAKGLADWEANPDRYTGDLADLAHKARAAIAKAEGGEP